jgi:hypothetical protein
MNELLPVEALQHPPATELFAPQDMFQVPAFTVLAIPQEQLNAPPVITA